MCSSQIALLLSKGALLACFPYVWIIEAQATYTSHVPTTPPTLRDTHVAGRALRGHMGMVENLVHYPRKSIQAQISQIQKLGRSSASCSSPAWLCVARGHYLSIGSACFFIQRVNEAVHILRMLCQCKILVLDSFMLSRSSPVAAASRLYVRTSRLSSHITW